MRTLLALAVRNVSRNKARSGITIGAILFSVLMTVLLGGFITGLQNLVIDDAIRARVGAIQVHRKGYSNVAENQPLKLDLEQGGALEARLRGVPGVAAVSPRITFSGLINNGSQATMFLGVAADPAQEREVLPGESDGVTGKPVSAADPRGAVVGSELAESLGATPGSNLTLQASSQAGRENALDLDVVGTLNNGFLLESKRMVYMPLGYAQDLLGMKGRVTEFVLAVRERQDIERVARDLRSALGDDYEVQTWEQLRPNIRDIIRVQDVVFVSICAVFLTIAVIGVINTMLMSVLERTREIGTMMAVGVRRVQISALFVFEAAAQAALGAAMGGLLGKLVVATVVGAGGIPLVMPGGSASVHILPHITGGYLSYSVTASTVGAVLAALYPAYRAARLRPVEALRDA